MRTLSVVHRSSKMVTTAIRSVTENVFNNIWKIFDNRFRDIIRVSGRHTEHLYTNKSSSSFNMLVTVLVRKRSQTDRVPRTNATHAAFSVTSGEAA